MLRLDAKGKYLYPKAGVRKVLKSPSLKAFKNSSENTCQGWYKCT